MALTGVVYKWRLDNVTYVYITDTNDQAPLIVTDQTCDEEKIKEIVSSWDEETYRLRFNRMVTVVHSYSQWANLRFLDYSVYLKECSDCEETLKPSLPTDIKINAKTRIDENLTQPSVSVKDGDCIIRDGEKVKVFDMEFVMPKMTPDEDDPYRYDSSKYSYMFGQADEAQGLMSITEGYNTYAGDYIGESNEKIGSEGDNIIGAYTHAEGNSSIAGGSASHAEGKLTLAGGLASHAEGIESYAIGEASHAEGGSSAHGSFSHAEGILNTAYGDSSHAEGNENSTNGEASHVEGYRNLIELDGFASHAEGEANIAYGEASHVEGSNNQTYGYASHAEGIGNHAYSAGSHVCGRYATIDSAEEFIFQVGVGTGEDDRMDAFVIRNDGTFIFYMNEEE